MEGVVILFYFCLYPPEKWCWIQSRWHTSWARLSEMCTRPKKRQPLLVTTKMSRVLGFYGTYHDDHLAPCVKCWSIAVLMIWCWFDGPIPRHRRRDCGLKFSLWNDLGSSFGLCSHERPGSYIFVRLVGWLIMINSYRENPHADMLTHALLVFLYRW